MKFSKLFALFGGREAYAVLVKKYPRLRTDELLFAELLRAGWPGVLVGAAAHLGCSVLDVDENKRVSLDYLLKLLGECVEMKEADFNEVLEAAAVNPGGLARLLGAYPDEHWPLSRRIKIIRRCTSAEAACRIHTSRKGIVEILPRDLLDELVDRLVQPSHAAEVLESAPSGMLTPQHRAWLRSVVMGHGKGGAR